MSVDENLLARNSEDDSSSNNKKEGESGARQGNQGRGRDGLDDSEPQSLREARIMERAKAHSKSKKEEAKKTVQAEASSKLLTVCFSLKTLSASWGLSALYGNVHLFLKYTINDKLRGLKLKESMILFLVDVIIILLILAILSLIAMITGFISSPLDAISSMLKSVFPDTWPK